jgi:hypothetical protein
VSSEKLRLRLIGIHDRFNTWFSSNPRAVVAIVVTALFAVLLQAYETRQQIVESKAGHRQSQEIRKHGRASAPLITLYFRGDFTAPEAVHRGVDHAFSDLERVSCGLAQAKIVWDYSREWDLPKAALRGDNIIQGISTLEVEASLGREDADDLLGITRSAKSPRWNPVWIFLVSDRLDDNDQLAEWTALHELGHALGMNHVKNGLMEPRAPYFFGLEDRPEWSVEDQNEFCRLFRCDPSAFMRCEFR